MENISRLQSYLNAVQKLVKQLNLPSDDRILEILNNPKITDSLSRLDKLLKSDRVNLRSIKNSDYIREVLETYIYDDKQELCDLINEKFNELTNQRNNLRKDVKSLNEESVKLKGELMRLEGEFK